MFSKFTPEEVERRRRASVEAMRNRERDEFAARYQEHCDRIYWTRGQCCAGCDHWQSDGGDVGRCAGAGIVSGMDVMRSMGAQWSSYIPEPGFPFTRADQHCGLFRDEFDWSTLDAKYLLRIGAMDNGEMKQKPREKLIGGDA